MRLRIWGRVVAGVAGVAALAGSAAAQAPARGPVVIPQQVVAQPAPGPTAPTVPPVATVPPAAVAAPAGPTVVTGSGGCTNCSPANTAGRGFVMSSQNGGYVHGQCSFGQACNNGCGSLRSDLGVVFGSCRTFFGPCGPGLFQSGCGNRGSCNRPVGGTGPAGPFNPCVYDSYLNH